MKGLLLLFLLPLAAIAQQQLPQQPAQVKQPAQIKQPAQPQQPAQVKQTAQPQQTTQPPLQLNGKVRSKNTSEILANVTISNKTLGKHNFSDLGGNYRITARPGDTLIVSCATYHADTLLITPSMLGTETTLLLSENAVTLPSVSVTESNYQKDSAGRHEDYAWLLDKKHPVKLMNEKRPGDGPGLSFSPLGYYSKDEVRKRRLKKRLKQEEEDYFVDFRFPRERVGALTGLKGDSLSQFMIRFRPTYKFCRSANTMDMLLYINDKLVSFRKGFSQFPDHPRSLDLAKGANPAKDPHLAKSSNLAKGPNLPKPPRAVIPINLPSGQC
jgi:hypothetical protein